MSDEKKGAVLTGEELDELERLRAEVRRINRSIGAGPMDSVSGNRLEDAHRAWGDALKRIDAELIHGARLARLAGAFLDQHAPTIRSWLCPSNGESPDEDAAIVACLEALESTIAAFRKGAE